MSVSVKLNPVNMKIVEHLDGATYILYNPCDDLIMVRVTDEHDVWYTFIYLIHRPEIKTVLYVSMFECDFTARNNRREEVTNDMLSQFINESMVRNIMKLSDDFVVTDSKEVYNSRRDVLVDTVKSALPHEHIAYRILQNDLPFWHTDDLEGISSLTAEDFLDFEKDIPQGENRMHYATTNAYVAYLRGLFCEMDDTETESTFVELRINVD